MISAHIKIMSKRHEWAAPALKKMITLRITIGIDIFAIDIGFFEDTLCKNHFPFDFL